MTKIFTDEQGNRYRYINGAIMRPSNEAFLIEPLPAPARTESDVYKELDQIREQLNYSPNMTHFAHAVINAARELARMDLEKREK